MMCDGVKSMWQRGMVEYAATGFERFTEHDLRAKAGSDSACLERAAELLGDTVAWRPRRSTTAAGIRR